MKRPRKFQVLILSGIFLFLLGSGSLSAQTKINAKFNKQNQSITLDEDAPFGYQYHIDISTANFSSKEEAKAFFKPFNSDLFDVVVFFEKNIATVILNSRAKPNWTAKEWNAHIEESKQKN